MAGNRLRANIGMAYAKGHWERIERLKDRLPYLRYSAVHDRRSRPEHLAWHGIVLPVDHPWWRTHFPLNGWRCRCSTMQLDAADLARYGYSVFSVPDELTREWSDKRTDEISPSPRRHRPRLRFQHRPHRLGGRAPPDYCLGIPRGMSPWR